MPDPTERAILATPLPVGGGRVIASPFQFYTTGEDRLRVVSVNAQTGVRLKIQSRQLDTSGRIIANAWDHTPTTNRTTTTTDFELGSGALLNLTVFANAGAPLLGQTFVIVQLVRGAGAAALVLGTLLQGYVTGSQALGFPGSPIQSSLDSGGYFRTIVGTTPGAANPILETVPAGARWEMRSLSFTDVSVGGAVPVQMLFLDASGNTIGGAITPFNHPGGGASLLINFTAGYPTPFNPIAATTSRMYGGLPFPLVLPAGAQFTVINIGGQTYSGITYEVREWLEVP